MAVKVAAGRSRSRLGTPKNSGEVHSKPKLPKLEGGSLSGQIQC